jgi:CBS domain containing-hemolysin-like protein
VIALALFLKVLFLPASMAFVAVFAGAETALTSLSQSAIAQLKLRHPHLRALFEYWEKMPDRVLTSVIIGNTLGTVVCGVLAASIGSDLADRAGMSSRWFIPPISFAVSLLLFLFGETLPKILGRLYCERVAAAAIVFMVPFTRLAHGFVRALVKIARVFVRIMGVESQSEVPTLTAAELRGMIDTGNAGESALPSRRILRNILEFGHLEVRDIFKPMDQVVAVDLRQKPMEVIRQVAQSSYARLPVYRDSLDNITGIIYAKDLLTAWRTEGLVLIPDLLRPVYFVSPDLRVSELLREFKKGHHHFAVVRGADGKAQGIITIENVLERIVGKVYDESKMELEE